MGAPKGHPKRGGRKKGTKNKRGIAVKESLMQAFDGIGGLDAFVEWARGNQTEFYKHYVKMLPQEIKTPDGAALLVKVLDLTGEPDAGDSA